VVWREPGPGSAAAPSAAGEIEAVVKELQVWLTDRGWPDPLEIVAVQNGSSDWPIVEDPLDLIVVTRVSASGAHLAPGWRAIREHLEARREALTDEWYAAKLIGIGLDALHGEGDVRDWALMNFGYFWRDWRSRRTYGRIAKQTVASRKRLSSDASGGRAELNRERRKAANEWQSEANRLASDLWQRKPKLPATVVAAAVLRELEALHRQEQAAAQEAVVHDIRSDLTIPAHKAKHVIDRVREAYEPAGAAAAKLPSEKRIRDVIAPLKPGHIKR
jgi:hypothetical protein